MTSKNQVKSQDLSLPATFPCKVISGSSELPRSSRQWTRAKKCKLTLKEDCITFNDTKINYSSIDKASIHIYKSALFLEYGILSIKVQSETYHFGIKYDDFWKADLPFEVQRIMEETPFLLFRKSLIIVILIYIFWELMKR